MIYVDLRCRNCNTLNRSYKCPSYILAPVQKVKIALYKKNPKALSIRCKLCHFKITSRFRLNTFYCITKQRDWTQVITTLDSPFPNVATYYIYVTMVDTMMFTAYIYNHTYHHPPIPWHHCCWNNIAKKACRQACQLFKPLWVFNEFDSELNYWSVYILIIIMRSCSQYSNVSIINLQSI